jgi:mono/diheme cytochrome c family protein
MPLVAAATPVESAPPESIRDMAAARRLVDHTKLARGRQVFAENCIACHSSIQPPMRHEQMAKDAAQTGSAFYDHEPGRWMTSPQHKDYQDWAKAAVEMPEFWRANYLSTDYRIAVNYVRTNSCRAVATNALNGNMWHDFASDSYRSLPAIGDIRFYNPYGSQEPADQDSDRNNEAYSPRHKTSGSAPRGGGGPGYYRVPTLVSIWATAPFLHNNSLGKYNANPHVQGRVDAFNDAIRKLLWKEKRAERPQAMECRPRCSRTIAV